MLLLSSFFDGVSTRKFKSKGSKIFTKGSNHAKKYIEGKGYNSTNIDLTGIGSLTNMNFPMWEVDDSGNRLETKPWTIDFCEWNTFFVTKSYDGLHPD